MEKAALFIGAALFLLVKRRFEILEARVARLLKPDYEAN